MTHDALQIQFDLKRRGMTQTALALRLGVQPSIVSKVISGRERSGRIEKAIEEIIGWSPFGSNVTRKVRTNGDPAV